MSALIGRHPQWLAKRLRLFADANAIDCKSEAFDAYCSEMSGLEVKLMTTPAANRAEACARVQFAAVIHAEGTVLSRDDAGDLLANIAPFLAPVVDRQTWDDAKLAYIAARAADDAFYAENLSPAYRLPVGPGRKAALQAIPASAWAEYERIGQAVSVAEDAVMAIPSPDANAFAFKCRIAHGDGRETDCWNDMLDDEAKRFAGEA